MNGTSGSRDIIVIGASAGGVEALRAVVAGLPVDLPAVVLIVLHIPRSTPSALATILGRVAPLPVSSALDGLSLRRGHIYVAPPDHHLLLMDNRIRLSRGPSEGGHRPAIDPLFRSAARAYGPHVVGVILSGARDDGASGLAIIHSRGGATVVQDPEEALHPSMPLAALAATSIDHVVPAVKIGPLLGSLAREKIAVEELPNEDPTLGAEIEMANNAGIVFDEPFGEPAGFGCPVCGGSLFEVERDPIKRYRCRVGHAWSAQALIEEQSAQLESALWMALRALKEKAALGEQLAGRGTPGSRERFAVLSRDASQAAEVIRELMERLSSVTDEAGT